MTLAPPRRREHRWRRPVATGARRLDSGHEDASRRLRPVVFVRSGDPGQGLLGRTQTRSRRVQSSTDTSKAKDQDRRIRNSYAALTRRNAISAWHTSDPGHRHARGDRVAAGLRLGSTPRTRIYCSLATRTSSSKSWVLRARLRQPARSPRRRLRRAGDCTTPQDARRHRPHLHPEAEPPDDRHSEAAATATPGHDHDEPNHNADPNERHLLATRSTTTLGVIDRPPAVMLFCISRMSVSSRRNPAHMRDSGCSRGLIGAGLGHAQRDAWVGILLPPACPFND